MPSLNNQSQKRKTIPKPELKRQKPATLNYAEKTKYNIIHQETFGNIRNDPLCHSDDSTANSDYSEKFSTASSIEENSVGYNNLYDKLCGNE